MPNEAGEVEGHEGKDTKRPSLLVPVLVTTLLVGGILGIAFWRLNEAWNSSLQNPSVPCGMVNGKFTQLSLYPYYDQTYNLFMLGLGATSFLLFLFLNTTSLFLKPAKAEQFNRSQWPLWLSVVNSALAIAYLVLLFYSIYSPRNSIQIICDTNEGLK